GVAQLAEPAHAAGLRRVPVDAVARLAQLRLGEKVGRTIAQPAADDRKQLAGDAVQRFAADTQRAPAHPRGQDKGRALAHLPAGCPPQTTISGAESGLFMAASDPST